MTWKLFIFLFVCLIGGYVYILFFREEPNLSQDAFNELNKAFSTLVLTALLVGTYSVTVMRERIDLLERKVERLEKSAHTHHNP